MRRRQPPWWRGPSRWGWTIIIAWGLVTLLAIKLATNYR